MLGEPGVKGTILEPFVNRVLSTPNFVFVDLSSA